MARGDEFPGVSDRLREMFMARGYWYTYKHRPEITRFCHRFSDYDPRTVASWLNPTNPTRPSLQNLQRLANDLECSMLYLLHGRRIYDDPEWSRLMAMREQIHQRDRDEAATTDRRQRRREPQSEGNDANEHVGPLTGSPDEEDYVTGLELRLP